MVELEVDISQLEGLPLETEMILDKAINYLTQSLLREVVKEAPNDNSDLVTSFEMGKKESLAYYVGSNIFYRWYVHEGTGIYGPHETEITPTEKEAMAFSYDGQYLVRKSVKGQEPNPYYDRAIENVEDDVQMFIEKAIEDLF